MVLPTFCGCRTQFRQQLPNRRDRLGIELFHLRRVYRYTHSTCPRMNAEWRFEQVIPVLRDVGVQSWVCVLQYDVFCSRKEYFGLSNPNIRKGKAGRRNTRTLGPVACLTKSSHFSWDGLSGSPSHFSLKSFTTSGRIESSYQGGYLPNVRKMYPPLSGINSKNLSHPSLLSKHL